MNQDYWRQRFAMLEAADHRKSEEYLRELEKLYLDTQLAVQKEIEAWYGRFAKNNCITLTEAKKLLTSRQLEEFKWTVEQYVKAGEQAGLNEQWMKQLENASARFHISRLEAIQMQISQQIELLYGNQVDGIDALLRELIQNGYTRGAYEVQKGIGLGWDLVALDQGKLDALLAKPWTTDGRTFRDRCWSNKAALVDSLHRELIQSTLRGDASQKTIAAIQKQFGTARYQAARLVHTETSYFGAVSKRQMYGQLGVEQLEIVETLDSHTCALCQPMDGKVVPLSQYQPGVTVPPFHPNCRGTTCPHYDDMEGKRAARDAEGKVYYVPADMTYAEWEKTFVEGIGKENLTEAKLQKSSALKTSAGFDIITVDHTTITAAPNSITQKTNAKGGTDRNFYGTDGRQICQISNHGHGHKKEEAMGKHGEHAHDYVWSEDGHVRRSEARELTEQERRDNDDFL